MNSAKSYSCITGGWCRLSLAAFVEEQGRERVALWGGRTRLERLRGTDYRLCEGSRIPSSRLRFCGGRYLDDGYFVASGNEEAQRAVADFGVSTATRLLEIGCGPGRFAIGLLRVLGDMEAYHGMDVDRASVRWCKRHISGHHPSFRFTHVDAESIRYNPSGKRIDDEFRLPVRRRQHRSRLCVRGSHEHELDRSTHYLELLPAISSGAVDSTTITCSASTRPRTLPWIVGL